MKADMDRMEQELVSALRIHVEQKRKTIVRLRDQIRALEGEIQRQTAAEQDSLSKIQEILGKSRNSSDS
jgi:hypothetical protein